MSDEESQTQYQHPNGVDAEGNLVALKLVGERKPTEAEIAADFKRRAQEAFAPLLALMDEATAAGLLIQFDGIGPQPPFFRNTVVNLRVAKYY